jgi:hypothetical protein
MLATVTKDTILSYEVKIVTAAVQKMVDQAEKMKLVKIYPKIGVFELSIPEFLSGGATMFIDVQELSGNRTKISLELRRNVGSYDRWTEIMDAHRHIRKVLLVLDNTLPERA